MIKIVITTIFLVVSVFLLALSSYFEQEQHAIEKINKKHIENIKKLDKIAQINTWLDTIIKSKLGTFSQNEDEAEYHLVTYFDRYVEKYHFQVNRYIYDKDDAKNLDISYEIKRNDTKALDALMSIEYENGFLQFNQLEMDSKSVKGSIRLIQPYSKDNNAS